MRSRFLLCLIAVGIILSAVPLFAQNTIPVYPGSRAEFELNLTQKDFLPVIRQWVGMVPGIAAGIIGGGEDAGQRQQMLAMGQEVAQVLQSALAGVNQISVVAYQQPKDVPIEQIADFYVREMGLDNGWLRTFVGHRPEGSAMLYVKPDLAAVFAAGVGQGYVAAAKVDGRVDLLAIGQIFAKYGPMVVSHFTAGGGGSVQPQESEQAGYDVILTEVGPQRVRVLGVIRQISGMNPIQAREFVESLPQPLAVGLCEDEAKELAASLESIGAKVELKPVE